MTNKPPVSEDLRAAISICSDLTVEELLDLLQFMGKRNPNIRCRDEWATAISTVLMRKCPTPGMNYN